MPHYLEWSPPKGAFSYKRCDILQDRKSGLAHLHLELRRTGAEVDEYQVVIDGVPVKLVTPKGYTDKHGVILWNRPKFKSFVQQEWDHWKGVEIQKSFTASLAGTDSSGDSSWGNWTYTAPGSWTYTPPESSQ